MVRSVAAPSREIVFLSCRSSAPHASGFRSTAASDTSTGSGEVFLTRKTA